MSALIRNLGSFTSTEEAWARYPEGGREGDYIEVSGEVLLWNKYDHLWGQSDGWAKSARKGTVLEGDLTVYNDLLVGGVLKAQQAKLGDILQKSKEYTDDQIKQLHSEEQWRYQWAHTQWSLSTPEDGDWVDNPSNLPEGGYLWIRSGKVKPPNLTPERWSPPTRVTGADAFHMVLFGDKGEVLRDGVEKTRIYARLYQGAKDITDSIPEPFFKWRRMSSDPEQDAVWGYRYGRSIEVSNLDIFRGAVFECEVSIESYISNPYW